MIFPILFALFAVLVLIFACAIFGSGFGRHYSVADLASQTLATDLEAFSNLVDREEENYLRTALNRSEFAAVQRLRLAAARQYVFNVMHNAGIILAVAEGAQRHHDPEIVELGKNLANAAVRLRMTGYAALYKLAIGYVWPSSPPLMSNVIRRYKAIETTVANLCHIQAPADVDRILAAL
jgi:hypothetical protein